MESLRWIFLLHIFVPDNVRRLDHSSTHPPYGYFEHPLTTSPLSKPGRNSQILQLGARMVPNIYSKPRDGNKASRFGDKMRPLPFFFLLAFGAVSLISFHVHLIP